MIVLAHGVGSRTDLPLPLGFALYGAGAAILAGFAVLLLVWRTPHLGGPDSGRPVPLALQRLVDSTAVRRGLQAVALVIAALVVVAALAGPDDSARNLGPSVLYITFWVGLVPVSLLLGPVWRVVNPLRLLHRLLRPLGPAAPGAARLPTMGLWPAAGALTVFVWLELVFPDRAEPMTVAVFLLGYAVVQLALAQWFGAGWFAHGDGFEAWSTLIARLSPWGRRGDGRLVLRNPVANALATPSQPGLAALVTVLLGSTAFDGLTRTVWWRTGPGAAEDWFSGTVGLLLSITVVAGLYVLGTRLSGRLARQDERSQPGRYAATVIPIALGYTVAHYVGLLVLDGQRTWILLSNPFGADGVDLFGTYGNRVDPTAVSADLIALVQVGAIITGHVVGVVLAHERALLSARRARASDQLPLVLVMVVFTLGGLGLLFGF